MLRATFPLLVFVCGALALALYRCPDEKGYWPIALIALGLSVLVSRRPAQSAQHAIEGMSDQLVSVMVCAWLLAATLGQFLREAGLVPFLATALHDSPPGVFLAGVFLISSVVATGTGTAVGTILLVTPVLFPLGATVGADPHFLLGAVLAGGAFGDDYSPLSDTTIASANTQGVSISNAVKDRLKYVLPPAALALVGYLLFGGLTRNTSQAAEPASINAVAFLMLVPPAIVVGLCFARLHILASLLAGIVSAVVLGMITGIVPPQRVLSFDPDALTAKSILIDGMSRGVGISVFSILLMGIVGVARHRLAASMHSSASSDGLSKAKAEALIMAVTIGANAVLAHNTVTILATQDIASRLRRRSNLAPLRVSQIVDLSANTIMHMLPYMVTVIIAVAAASKDVGLYGLSSINPVRAGLLNLHSLGLFMMLLVVIGSGLWRGSSDMPSE
jgi:Na+/H+ antiporter NhaC